MRTCVRWAFITSSIFFLAAPARSQSLGNAGTVDGSVVDQCGAAIPKAEIQIHNPVSGYPQSTIAANDGSFHLVNIPLNQYHLEIKASGFSGFNGIPSQENDDHNPDRVTPRHVFNLGIGTDNLLRAEGPRRLVASVEIENLTNTVALYNFLSTFRGTHFLQPRTVVARFGLVF